MSQLRGSSPKCSLVENRIFTYQGSFPLIQCTPQHIKFNNAFVNFCYLISVYEATPRSCGYLIGMVWLFVRAGAAHLSVYTTAYPFIFFIVITILIQPVSKIYFIFDFFAISLIFKLFCLARGNQKISDDCIFHRIRGQFGETKISAPFFLFNKLNAS